MAKTYDIDGYPGESATFTEPADFTTRQERVMARATASLPKSIIDGAKEAEAAHNTDGTVDDADVEMPDPELLDAMWIYNDTVLLTMLESWTLDRPVPATADELQDLPGKLYKALAEVVARVQEDNPDLGTDGGFGVDAVVDRTSPTGA